MNEHPTHASIVRVIGSQGSGSLRGQFIELTGGNALVDPGADLLRHRDRVAVLRAQPITQLLQPCGDLVEVHRLLTPVSLHHVHLRFGRHALRGISTNRSPAQTEAADGSDLNNLRGAPAYSGRLDSKFVIEGRFDFPSTVTNSGKV